MFNNIYVLKINNKKILNKLIKYNVYFLNIDFKDNNYYVDVDYYNYNKILKYKKIYEIELISIKGLLKYKYLLKKYYIISLIMFVGIFYLYFLSNIIFKVNILTNDKEIRDIISNELNYHGISKYKFKKNYNEKEWIKNHILNDNKKTIEWLEIDRVGNVYNIYVERRIINNIESNNNPRNVVSKKNAIILEIRASNGSIVKKVNDYVSKGDIIVSGIITKGDKVVNKVKADAIIYGETWYTVKVELPINYYDKTYTGKVKKKLSINFFNKRIKLFNFNNYEQEEINDYVIYENKLLPISLCYSSIKEVELIDDIYTSNRALEIGINLSREKLLTIIPKNSKITSQKKLNLYEKDSKIILVVFFKVYEDITDYKEITLIEGE